MAVDDSPDNDVWSLPWDADLSRGPGSAHVDTRTNAWVPEACFDLSASEQLGPAPLDPWDGPDALAMGLGELPSREEDLSGSCSSMPQHSAFWSKDSAANVAMGLRGAPTKRGRLSGMRTKFENAARLGVL